MSANLILQPITVKDASRFVDLLHRHHKAPRGGLFAVAANDGTAIVGVAIVGRPGPKAYQDGWTCEVTRHCTDSTPHVASKLYAACWRAARALGYRRMGSYTLKSEPGTSLKAAQWIVLYETRDRPSGWNTPSRPRTVKAPTEGKQFWAPEECWERFRIPIGAAVSIGVKQA